MLKYIITNIHGIILLTMAYQKNCEDIVASLIHVIILKFHMHVYLYIVKAMIIILHYNTGILK